MPAWVSYAIGASLAFYWTQISPLSFGATVPTFVLTFVLYLVARAAADRLSTRKTAVETDHKPG